MFLSHMGSRDGVVHAGTVSDRVYAGHRGGALLVGEEAAVDRHPGCGSPLGVGEGSDSDHHSVCR